MIVALIYVVALVAAAGALGAFAALCEIVLSIEEGRK